MAPQNEVSIEIAVKYTEVQTSAYSVPPQSELKGPTEGSYGFISFLKHTFCDLYFPIFKKRTVLQYVINITQIKS